MKKTVKKEMYKGRGVRACVWGREVLHQSRHIFCTMIVLGPFDAIFLLRVCYDDRFL